MFKATDKSDPVALKIEQIVEKELAEMPSTLKNLETQNFPLLPYNVLGIEKLRSLLDKSLQQKLVNVAIPDHHEIKHPLEDLTALVSDLEKNTTTGLIMTMGKGGVGKTIIAASIATMLAKRGHHVLLTTTDPAAHIKDFIAQLDEIPETLVIE
eukprot:Opistho-1_new@59507